MAQSRQPGPTQHDPFTDHVPARTPGSLGIRDAADPNEVAPPGDTPGPIGFNDSAELLALAGGKQARRKRAKRKAKRTGKVVVLVAGGFKLFGSDAEEAEFLEKLGGGTITARWYPSTRDFLATANDTQSRPAPIMVSTAADVLGALQHEPGVFGRVIFIGHGSPGGLGLTGSLSGSMMRFSEMLRKEDLTDPKWDTVVQQIKDKFREDATFDIYACNVAVGDSFMKELARAFDVRVRSFKGEVWWCVQHDAKSKTITSRGRVAPEDGPADCSQKPWRKGVRTWIPPETVDP